MIIRLYKIFAFDFGLRADCAECRAFDPGMIGDRHWRDRMIRIISLQRNMNTFANNFKVELFQSGKNFCFWGVVREFSQGMVTSVSAMKSSLDKLDLFSTFEPKVLR